MRLYIIGPVTGHPNDNREAFEKAREDLEAAGYQVDIPHDYVNEGEDWQQCMRRSITAMLALDHKSKPVYDGVAMLPGWDKSKGATIERDIAVALSIPCHYIGVYLYGTFRADQNVSQPIFAPAC